MLKKLFRLLSAMIAFINGFVSGLNRPPRSTNDSIAIAAYLETDTQPPQLPPVPLREELTSIELETIAAAEPVQMSRERLIEYIDATYVSEPEPQPEAETQADPQPSESIAPQLSRAELVEALLDEAWYQGMKTYPELIDYVRQQSGTGCSRRAIAAWKDARKLNESSQQQAA